MMEWWETFDTVRSTRPRTIVDCPQRVWWSPSGNHMPRLVCDICSYIVWQSLIWNECPGPGYGTLQRAKRNERWMGAFSDLAASALLCNTVFLQQNIDAELWTTEIYSHNFFNESWAFTKIQFWYDPLRLSSCRCSFPSTVSALLLCTTCAVNCILLVFSTLQYYENISVLIFCMLFSPMSCYCPLFGHELQLFSELLDLYSPPSGKGSSSGTRRSVQVCMLFDIYIYIFFFLHFISLRRS
jgi:hypothetical protein